MKLECLIYLFVVLFLEMSTEIRIVGEDDVRRALLEKFGADATSDAIVWLKLFLLSLRGAVLRGSTDCLTSVFSENVWHSLYIIEQYTALGTDRCCESFLRDVANSVTAIVAFICCSSDCSANDDIERLTESLSRILANCSGSTAGHMPDKELCFSPNALCVNEDGVQTEPECMLCEQEHCVQVGFTGYAEGETGARLWAGATALSVYLTEHFHTNAATVEMVLSLQQQRSTPFRVLELGCGPALLSCTLLHLLHLHAGGSPPDASCSRSCCVTFDVTDVSASVVHEAKRSVRERNKLPEDPRIGVNFFTVDFTDVPAALGGTYDLIVASDVVYDLRLSTFVAPAIVALLRPGGSAIICCERHRDGMETFVPSIQDSLADMLEIEETVDDATRLMQRFVLPAWLSTSTCALVRLRRRGTAAPS